MTKRDPSIANTTVTKGTDGVEWLKFLQDDPGEAARRPDGNPGQPEPDWNQGADSLSAAAVKQPTKQRAATAASAARSNGAKGEKFFSARRES